MNRRSFVRRLSTAIAGTMLGLELASRRPELELELPPYTYWKPYQGGATSVLDDFDGFEVIVIDYASNSITIERRRP